MPISSPPKTHAAIAIYFASGSRLGIVPDAAYDLVLRPYQPMFFDRREMR